MASTEVHALADLARSPTVAFFEGARHGGGTELVAAAGHVVVVPPETAHHFWNSGDERLDVTSIHPAAEVQTTWL